MRRRGCCGRGRGEGFRRWGSGDRAVSDLLRDVRALGAAKVTYVDEDAGRLALASDLGAEVLQEAPPRRTERSYDVVLDAGTSRESLACACRSTAPGGDCTHVGILYEPETPVPL